MVRKPVEGPRQSSMVPISEERFSVDIDQDMDGNGDTRHSDDVNSTTTPLDERVLKLVASNPSKVYPTRLVTELGLSHEDASAELCGLLAAVGSGATFTFEPQPGNPKEVAMCFSFPKDFEKRARSTRRVKQWKENFWNTMVVLAKLIKIITAFGLILSLLIITVFAMIAMVAALIAISRSEGSQHQQRQLFRQMRLMFSTVRSMLWCYAMFGHTIEGQDPFLSEIAYDLALFGDVLCGSGFLFWWRAQELRARTPYMGRSWGRALRRTTDQERQALSDRPSGRRSSVNQDEYRGILSVAVEFLFGPVPFTPGPVETDIWKLRANVVMDLSNKHGGVTLKKIAPYLDDPPLSLDDQTKINSGGVAIVAHFGGIPKQTADNQGEKIFIFPELLAESTYVMNYKEEPNLDDGTFSSLFYNPDILVTSSLGNGTPTSLHERRYRLTHLTATQFIQCSVLGSLNFIGVLWLRQTLSQGGVLFEFFGRDQIVTRVLRKGLVRFLLFYASLFLFLPLGRLVIISIFNRSRNGRNQKREDLAYALTQTDQPESVEKKPLITTL